MSGVSPAVEAARTLAGATSARLLPLELALAPGQGRAGFESVSASGRPLLAVGELAGGGPLPEGLAGAVDRMLAVVLWAPGWDEHRALAALGNAGLEHGSVELLREPQPGALCVICADAPTAAMLQAAMRRQAPAAARALAIMPAYNEADVIFHSIGAMVEQGVDVYLIDHESDDGTADAARPWLDLGLVAIEQFPGDLPGYGEESRGRMAWKQILRRVQEIAAGHPDYDWHLFVNADEFREAPWPGASLAQALAEAGQLGFSAVNFALYDFRPTDESCTPGSDPRERLRHYQPGASYDLLQVKAWRSPGGEVDLVSSGGHNAQFPARRVFPVPFILRHYPIRSSAHGQRKVFSERLPRFAAEERAEGWHCQYDEYAEGRELIADPAGLERWNGDRVRAALLARCLHDLLLALTLAPAAPLGDELNGEALAAWLARCGPVAALPEIAAAGGRLMTALEARDGSIQALDPLAGQIALGLAAVSRLRGEPGRAAELDSAAARTPGAGARALPAPDGRAVRVAA